MYAPHTCIGNMYVYVSVDVLTHLAVTSSRNVCTCDVYACMLTHLTYVHVQCMYSVDIRKCFCAHTSCCG